MSKHLTEAELLKAVQLLGNPDGEWLGDPDSRGRFFVDLAQVLADHGGAEFCGYEDDLDDEMGDTYSFKPTDSTPGGGGVLSLFDKDVYWPGQDIDPKGAMEFDVRNGAEFVLIPGESFDRMAEGDFSGEGTFGNKWVEEQKAAHPGEAMLLCPASPESVPENVDPELAFKPGEGDGEVVCLVAWKRNGRI